MKLVRHAVPGWHFKPVQAAGGRAYLLVKVGRDGKVSNVVVEQVNLKFVASDTVMDQCRAMFARVSMSKARHPHPWKQEDEGAAFSPDALPPGGMHTARFGFRPLTDLSGS